jgi:drug/metabolite transporter (DMT)-like permease
MARRWSRLVTIAAGVLGALVCYGVITYCVVNGGLVSDGAKSLQATRMISANVGAIAAAAVVGTFPSDRHAPFFESFVTWAIASVMLLVILAPRHPLIL